ncbi:hypothetical protein PILCRDRAFT_693741 [Piloderma croceum F 1598]|uniref:Uncharacterized protein n=1 Tax=Piloderma croceum (strain F 1598) TaxID=765440 RepID=A0A0C3EQE7_PILCF|nr:hypothetical protein PILCRDRAFT_693741 [Piloderma croceum F 1598]
MDLHDPFIRYRSRSCYPVFCACQHDVDFPHFQTPICTPNQWIGGVPLEDMCVRTGVARTCLALVTSVTSTVNSDLDNCETPRSRVRSRHFYMPWRLHIAPTSHYIIYSSYFLLSFCDGEHFATIPCS